MKIRYTETDPLQNGKCQFLPLTLEQPYPQTSEKDFRQGWDDLELETDNKIK